MIDASNIYMKVPLRKFSPKRLGPFKVLEDKGNGAFVLDLPPHFKIYNTLKACRLSSFAGKLLPLPDPTLVDGIPKFKVEEVIASRRVRKSLQHLLLWKGYSNIDNSWVPSSECVNCWDLVLKFHQRCPKALGPPRAILALTIPKAHKNYSLAACPQGGILPQKRGKGNVKIPAPL